jgi:hypothetical protein
MHGLGTLGGMTTGDRRLIDISLLLSKSSIPYFFLAYNREEGIETIKPNISHRGWHGNRDAAQLP